MAAIRSTYRYPCDLGKGATEVTLKSPLMQSDAEADEFRAQILRNGVPVSVVGMTVYGYLYHAMEQTTILLDGTVSGSEASVILSSECYKHPGYASMAIQVVEGDVRHTVLKVNLCITRTGNDYVVDTENVIPTLPELLGKIGALEQATDAANATIADVTVRTGEAINATNAAAAETRLATIELVKTAGPAIVPTAAGAIVTVTDAADRPAVAIISHIEPVQEGEGDPSPENVRPISGHDALSVTRCGKNLTPEFVSGYWEPVGAAKPFDSHAWMRTPELIRVNPNTVYTVSNVDGDARPITGNIILYDANKMATRYFDNPTFTVEKNEVYVAMYTGVDAYKLIQLEEGASATAFEPYQGQTMTASFPETIYGGMMDWVTGVLTKKAIIRTVNASSEVFLHATNIHGLPIYRIPLDKATADANYGVCNLFPYNYSYNNNFNSVFVASTSLYVVIHPELLSSNDEAGFKAFLAANPIEIAYEDASPETIQLTPQQINTLKGLNNVWSNAGETELSYIADTKLYIDQRIAALLNL